MTSISSLCSLLLPINPGSAPVNNTLPVQPAKPARSLTRTEEFAADQQKLTSYLTARGARAKETYGDTPPNAVAVAMPVVPGRGAAFITADQQRTIDGITAKYGDGKNLDALMDELWENNVHPDQVTQTSKWFISAKGIVDRDGERVPVIDIFA